MCDTFIATGSVTPDGITIFAKNSDRDPNEAQYVISLPAADHAPGSMVKCTYIEIPQARHTHGVMLSKPFWIWGAEMGVNERGLVIGNEAVFTREKTSREPGLIGMDFLRLALERASTSYEALEVITGLLQEHGQGGNCGFQNKIYYHNSFILADSGEAWVLETSGRHWAARKINGFYSISNGLTIENEWDLASPDLVDFAVANRWCKDRDDFSFSACYSDKIFTRFSDCRRRRGRTMELLAAGKDRLTAHDAIDMLRDHYTPDYDPGKGLTGASVCMHAGWGPVRISQTTGSLVAHLDPEKPAYFATGTAAPCTSIFKPVWPDAMPDMGPLPSGTYDEASLFWRHEALHRSILRDYRALIKLIKPGRDEFEKQFVSEALLKAGLNAEERQGFAGQCFSTCREAEDRWHEQIRGITGRKRHPLHRAAWRTLNKAAKMKY